MATKQIVERLVDALTRKHITEAQFKAKLASGYQPQSRVTVVIDVKEAKEAKENKK